MAENNNETAIADTLDDVLKWRKNIGINQISDQTFPTELYKIGFSVRLDTFDKSGRDVYYWRVNRWKKSPELIEMMLRYNAYQREKSFKSGANVLNIIDCQNVSPKNIDLDLIFVWLMSEANIIWRDMCFGLMFPIIFKIQLIMWLKRLKGRFVL